MPRRRAAAIDLHPQPIGFRVWHYGGDPAGMTQAHSHPDLEMNFLTRGWIRYAFGGRMITIEPGRMALFWASIPHQSIDADADTRGVWFTLPLPQLLSWNLPRKLDERLLRGEFVMARADAAADASDRFLMQRWVEDYNAPDPERRRTLLLEIEARLRRLAEDSAQEPARSKRLRPEPGIESALDFLHRNYREAVTADDIGRAAGFHPKYLMRVFKRTLGLSAGEYLMRLRVSHAQWLLIATDKSTLEIAFASGFQSLAPFYQAFRKVTNGVSPIPYRKKARAGQQP
jgi:AraC-like DNA-binding protein